MQRAGASIAAQALFITDFPHVAQTMNGKNNKVLHLIIIEKTIKEKSLTSTVVHVFIHLFNTTVIQTLFYFNTERIEN